MSSVLLLIMWDFMKTFLTWIKVTCVAKQHVAGKTWPFFELLEFYLYLGSVLIFYVKLFICMKWLVCENIFEKHFSAFKNKDEFISKSDVMLF